MEEGLKFSDVKKRRSMGKRVTCPGICRTGERRSQMQDDLEAWRGSWVCVWNAKRELRRKSPFPHKRSWTILESAWPMKVAVIGYHLFSFSGDGQGPGACKVWPTDYCLFCECAGEIFAASRQRRMVIEPCGGHLAGIEEKSRMT